MFNALLLSEDPTWPELIAQLAFESRQARIQRSLSRLPAAYELTRMLNSYAPDVVFLDFTNWQDSIATAGRIREAEPKTAIIGLTHGEHAHYGPTPVHAWLERPFSPRSFQDTLERAIHAVRPSHCDHLFAFIPAKAGSGSTTVSLQLAGVLTEEHKRRTLLIEADLHSGILGLLLNHTPAMPLREILAQAADLDDTSWAGWSMQRGKLSLLPAGRNPQGLMPVWSEYFKLLEFVAPRYDFVLVDLPEVINEASVEIVRRAAHVFVVLTAEMAPLKLAGRRIEDLDARGIDEERVSLVINRFQNGDLQPKQISELLGKPIAAVIPNDYREVQKAALGNGFVGRNSTVGKAYQKLSGMLVPGVEAEPAKSKFGLGRLLSGFSS